MGALLMLLGLVLIAFGFPADGLLGVALAASGLAFLWSGYYLVRRGGAS